MYELSKRADPTDKGAKRGGMTAIKYWEETARRKRTGAELGRQP